jgi:hypothetical protein
MFCNDTTRKALETQLSKGTAHMSFEEAIADFPMDAINTQTSTGYTPWHLLEHIRRVQFDILDIMVNPDYKEPTWPDDYWPRQADQASPDDWMRTISLFKKDRDLLKSIMLDPQTNIYTVLPQAKGKNRLEEVLIVSSHTSYHLGEFAILRSVMDTWPKNRRG